MSELWKLRTNTQKKDRGGGGEGKDEATHDDLLQLGDILLAFFIVGALCVGSEVFEASKLLIVADLLVGFSSITMFKFDRIARPLISRMRHGGSCDVFCKVSVKSLVVFELFMVPESLGLSRSLLVVGPPNGRRRRHGSFNGCREFFQRFSLSMNLFLHAEPTKKFPEPKGI